MNSLLVGIVFRSRRPPVSNARRAVERRVSRRLLADGLVLHKCDPRSRWHSSLGDYYLSRVGDRLVVTTHVDLDELAREAGAVERDQAIVDG